MTRDVPRDPGSKILDLPAAIEWRQQQKGRVVFTNGVFDLLHPGHVDILFGARQFGDALVVGMNSDASVKRLKGETRPIRNEQERAHVLGAFEMVDAIVIFEEDTPLELVTALRPDVLVKGGDYSEATIVGASQVRSWGGDVRVITLRPGQSTTNIIQALRGDSQ